MRIGIVVKCGECGKPKAPRGRSIPAAAFDSWCSRHSDCTGYDKRPWAGDLWPDETQWQFGFAIGPDGTREMTFEEERARMEQDAV